MSTTYGAIKNLAAYLAGRADDTASVPRLTPSEATSLRAFFAGDLPAVWDREAWSETCQVSPVLVPEDEQKFYNPGNVIRVSDAGYEILNKDFHQIDTLNGKPRYGDPAGDYIAWISDKWVIVHTLDDGSPVIVYFSSQDAATPDLVVAWTVDPSASSFLGPGAVLEPVPIGGSGVDLVQEITFGDIIGIYTADPRTSATYTEMEWTELDDVVFLKIAADRVYVDYQDAVPDLLDAAVIAEGDDYELPTIFKYPLACRGAAFLVKDEDPALAGRLANLAEADLLRQARQIKRPWWRVAKKDEN